MNPCCCCGRLLQEEVLLSVCMGLAICNLLASLRAENAMDYVYVSFFLICELPGLESRAATCC